MIFLFLQHEIYRLLLMAIEQSQKYLYNPRKRLQKNCIDRAGGYLNNGVLSSSFPISASGNEELTLSSKRDLIFPSVLSDNRTAVLQVLLFSNPVK